MDLNLLRVLDVLLQEGSVTRAAARLGSSPAAVSRTLAKLRRAAGDPLLVRAGQGLVPTPRALELKDEVTALVHRADRILGPGPGFTPADLRRTFTIQAADLVVSGLAGPLAACIQAEAPHVEVVFLPESTEDSGALRDGRVDLEIGAAGHHDPETRTEPLVQSAVLGIARQGNPLFDARVDPARFAAAEHIGISRRGKQSGPIDTALAQLGLHRRVAVVVPGHPSALILASSSDLVTIGIAGWLDPFLTALGLRTFDIPLDLPPIELGLAWHPRTAADPAQLWFRARVRTAMLAGMST
ncbi:LysR family transcriptional regulator [Amycolatopsis halotolerans]|uniref:LysR family transcriptional regulator n=2 Tax=Amycolatopsis halotolerans TaxID=330083 RepID=A0ABV7QMR2_9PSEU